MQHRDGPDVNTHGLRAMKLLGAATALWFGAKAAVVTGRDPLARVCAVASYALIALALLAALNDLKNWHDDQ